MHFYHITYKPTKHNNFTEGTTIAATNEIKALYIFRSIYKEVEFIGLILKNSTNIWANHTEGSKELKELLGEWGELRSYKKFSGVIMN